MRVVEVVEDELAQVWRDAAAAAAEDQMQTQGAASAKEAGDEYEYDEYAVVDDAEVEAGDAVFEEEIFWDEADEEAADEEAYGDYDEDSNAEGQDYPEEESSGEDDFERFER